MKKLFFPIGLFLFMNCFGCEYQKETTKNILVSFSRPQTEDILKIETSSEDPRYHHFHGTMSLNGNLINIVLPSLDTDPSPSESLTHIVNVINTTYEKTNLSTNVPSPGFSLNVIYDDSEEL